jgi:hypothetical protein
MGSHGVSQSPSQQQRLLSSSSSAIGAAPASSPPASAALTVASTPPPVDEGPQINWVHPLSHRPSPYTGFNIIWYDMIWNGNVIVRFEADALG